MNTLFHINAIRNGVNKMVRSMQAGLPYDQCLVINILTHYNTSGLRSSAIRESIDRLSDNWELGCGKAQCNKKIQRNIIQYLAVQKMVAKIEKFDLLR